MKLKFVFIISAVLAINFSMATARVWKNTNTTTSWTTAANWNPSGVPDTLDDITIPTNNNAKYPVISGSTYKCRNITFQGNGLITFASATSELKVYGSFDNQTGNTGIVDVKGKITFKGSSNTTITGSTAFNTIWVSKNTFSYKVSINSGTQTISTALKLPTGDFDVNGNTLILLAEWDAINGVMKTAYVDGAAVGDLIGTVKVQQAVAEGYKTYHTLCSPIQNATPADIADNTGSNTYNGSYAYPNSGTIPDWIYFYEPDQDPGGTNAMYGWHGMSSGSYSLAPMQGFVGRFLTSAGYLEWVGTVNDSNIVSPNLLYTNNSEPTNDGFNLVGNPYPSPIDWGYIWSNNGSISNLSSAIYVWQNDGGEYTGSYVFYDPNDLANSNITDGIIAIGQGFWVKTSVTNNSFTLTNSDRTTGSPYFYKTTNSPYSVALKLKGANNADETYIRLGENYTTGYDFSDDVAKMMNPSNSLYTLVEDGYLAANKLPFPEKETTVALGLNLRNTGTYTLTASNFTFDEKEFTAVFEDMQEKKIIPVNANFEYTFSASEGTSNDRFKVHILNNKTTQTPALPAGISCYYNQNGINIVLGDKGALTANATLTDINGRIIASTKTALNNGRGIINTQQLSTGIYCVNVITDNGSSYSQKILID